MAAAEVQAKACNVLRCDCFDGLTRSEGLRLCGARL